MPNHDRSDSAEVHFDRASLHETEGPWQLALEECDATIELDPSCADAYKLRGIVLEEFDRPGEAAKAWIASGKDVGRPLICLRSSVLEVKTLASKGPKPDSVGSICSRIPSNPAINWAASDK
jgi:hypothetical protein